MKRHLRVSLAAILILVCMGAAVGCADTDNKLTLVGINGTEVMGRLQAGTLTYILAPEPAVTTVSNKLELGEPLMDIQALYGGDYPQAVLLARNDVLEDVTFLHAFLTDLESAEEESWLKKNIPAGVTAILDHLEEGVVSTFVLNENSTSNLNENVITRCNIKTVRAAEAKSSVVTYIDKIRNVNAEAAKATQDSFFAGALSGETATGKAVDSVKVYMPDGAPALALAKQMHTNNTFGKSALTYHVLAADKIGAKVVADKPALALMPLNAATNIAASAGYTMLSVNTHGNLYIIGTGGATSLEQLAEENATVGVVNLANIPGLTLQAILKDMKISYQLG